MISWKYCLPLYQPEKGEIFLILILKNEFLAFEPRDFFTEVGTVTLMTRDYVICRDRYGAKALCRWDSFGCAVGNGLQVGTRVLLSFRSSNFRKIVRCRSDEVWRGSGSGEVQAVYETDMWIPPPPLKFAGRFAEILPYGGAAVAIVERSESHPNLVGEKVIFKLADCTKPPRVSK